MIRTLIMRHVFRVRTSATTRYCVALDEGRNSPVEGANHLLPGGLQSNREKAKVEVEVQIEVRSEV